MKSLTTADRLDLLLDWVNDADWRREKRLPDRITRFLKSFDGSEDAGFVRAEPFTESTVVPPRSLIGTEGIDDYEVLHTVLGDILQRGFPSADPFLPQLMDWTTMRFGIDRQAPVCARSWGKKRAGAYVLLVTGRPLELVTWLVMHLLTTPGAVALGRCGAPISLQSDERCGRFFRSKDIGRPRVTCSDNC